MSDERTTVSSGNQLNESTKKLLDSLSSTNKNVLRIMTEERNLEECFLDANLEEIAKDYNLDWLQTVIDYNNAYKRSHKRIAETKMVEVAKAILVHEQEEKHGAWDRFMSIFRGR